MTDAPRPDLTAADWAAMRATIEHEERATTHWDGCWMTHRNCRTLLALDALARLREAQTWQPIETAPKDGTEVLAWRGGRRGIVRWHENSSYWDEWHRPTAHCRVEPTHWMPLPRTPAKEADRG
jgi:hypothetical protein